jgi:REP-associated tyrosine transposase
MPNYRRYRVPGGTFFFTVVTYRRRRFLTSDLARKCLRDAIDTVRADWPFEMPAIILLPEHLHTIWTLPRGDDDYPTRWRRIKEEFTESWLAAGGTEAPLTPSRRKRKERGVWQRRYWEHLVENEHDFDRHFDYIHYNPVKHGEVKCPGDWLYSSFHRWVKWGVYESEWGCSHRGRLAFDDLDETAMEFHLDDE